MKRYKYTFSVIIPIYNVEAYLEETIESVINQTIGFEKNIQIILVNDGSPDNSEKICKKYTSKFPNNIKYIYQKNAGVSAARNNGLNYAEGEFINFLDSDDIWEKDVFSKAQKMFLEHDDIDIIGVRQKYFEASNAYPSLDYKFNKDKIVDIFNHYDHIQLSVTSAFIRSSAIGNVRYDTKVKYSEDAKFLNRIIIEKEKLGIIASSLHLYRKRASDNSAIQTKNTKDDWYLITPKECYEDCFELSKKKYGYVIPYFQFYVAYDYQWRIREPIPSTIKKEVIDEYLKITKRLFENIDDHIILEQNNISIEYKIYYLSLKHKKDITKHLEYINHYFYYNGNRIINLNRRGIVCLHTININQDIITIKGTINLCIPESDFKLYAVINEKDRIDLKLIDTNVYERKAFNEQYLTNKGFEIEIDLNKFSSLFFELVYNKTYKTKMDFSYGLNGKLDSDTKLYYPIKNKILYHYNKKLKVKPNTMKNRIHFSLRLVKYLINKKQYKVLLFRTAYKILKIFNHKKIWLVSDRPNTANDNGLHMFKYICSKSDKKVKPYFVISKNSNDYNKIKKIGKVLNFNSIKYKLYFLLANKNISSQADDWTINPFGKKNNYYRDLYNADFIFLQHGITKDDISGWLNSYDKNIKLFITAVQREYESIINNPKYGFNKTIVKLTGFPRYDNLVDKKEKLIAIMPTWRNSLASGIGNDGKRKYRTDYKKSEYFMFYNNLINDKNLIQIMKKYGYKGIFVVHPSHMENSIDYDGNETFEIVHGSADYQTIFSKASLLISDYSSVPFDFAYLHKPVIYTQFDKKEFFKNHTYKEGYFSYENDGFGPITYNYKETVDEIIKYIKSDCILQEKYKKRIDNFYVFTDKKNCERVYEEIKKL